MNVSRPHETLDIIGAGSILAIEYSQLLDGNWFGRSSVISKLAWTGFHGAVTVMDADSTC